MVRRGTGRWRGWPGCFDDHGGVAAVVERAGAQLPGIEMCAKNDRFVGFFAAANFADDVKLLDRAADLVRHGEVHANLAGIAATVRARRMASSRATTAWGITSSWPSPELVCR